MKWSAKVRGHHFMAKDRGNGTHYHCPEVRFKKFQGGFQKASQCSAFIGGPDYPLGRLCRSHKRQRGNQSE
ncbi:MAG: hypothetical protein CVV30_01150 [Methanomicrobiales archaeon HGW-Methanomicrobiales-1]|jgi:hypothetical protein|nr:MAG: hypothetical protein CVV30_01150 [Methanomicrobiales archaeon HGW-Methanomicrobiales-1]